MKKNTFLLILFILLGLTAVSAQKSISITGRLIDADTNETLPFANVSVNRFSDNVLVTGAVTDDDGMFLIENIPVDTYTIYFSYLGYAGATQKIITTGLNTVFDLGRIALFPDAEMLNEIEVSAKQATTNSELNKKSFNLSDNIAQSGGSVLDAMKTMPGVSFDQEGKVILRGSDKVVILIDGKQSSLTGYGNQKGLGNIPATNIEKIEIINNPSAKYDANGFAGIINIIYKKENQTGFNGDVGLSFGLGAFDKKKEDTKTDLGSFSLNPKLIPSLNFNYKTNKLNYFVLSEFIVQEALPNNEFTTRHYDDGRNTISQVPENRRQFRVIINGGLDWELTENDAITFSGMYDREKHIDTSQVAFTNLNTNTRERYYNWQEEEITSYINVAVNYKHKFSKIGHTLSANAQYTRGLEDESYFLNDSSAIRVGRDATNILAVEHTTSFSADYSRALKHGKIELGTKARIRRLPVDYTITPGNNSIIYPNMGAYSDWGENLYALYTNYLLEQEKFDIEAGMRAEHTDVFYDIDPANNYYQNNDAYNYFELFPSLRFTYKLNDYNKFSVFYNRRVDRPGEPELRIFPKYDDPELLKVGNPYLRPQFTDAMELAHKYSWGSGSLFSALYHRMTKDQYMRIFSIDDSNPDYDIVNKIYQNTGNATNTGIELLLSQDMTRNWKLSASFNWYANHIDNYTGSLLFPYVRPFLIEKSTDNAGDFKINNEVTLPKNWTLQLTGLYYSDKNIPQGKELSRSSIDAGIKKIVWDGHGEFTLSASDIFNTFGLRQEVKSDGFTAIYENYFETQIARVGFKYKF
ncbi:TonB-dependent receptor [Arenibacter sp. TNZ]|uniref:outer membrane beta-barrel protein n=1 Tax=Arenibacter TaxID=178469 RepID=UPI000CD4994E|nr:MULTISPECIES: outer membrane beta-barrel protein [Arenibacter]MCM4173608.1 TonB-dependent receptor [Arenibacter sp. TNZ]